MSTQTITLGASPHDGPGTPLRTSFDYTNQNFTELYTALGGGVGLPGATTQVIFNDGGTNLAGDAGLVYNKTTDTLTAGNATITGAATVATNVLVANAAGYTGKVGIATATPADFLEVVGSGANGIRVSRAGLPTQFATLSAGATGPTLNASSALGSLTFGIAGTAATAMTLDSTGLKVSTGTTNPLDLTNAAVTTERQIKIENSSVTAYLGVEPAAGGRFIGSAAGNAYFGTNVAYGLEFATNNNVRMTLNTTGNLAFASGKGIDFSAVTGGTGTATANVLNDYEEGTWVPAINALVGTFTTTTLSSATYTKIGRMVAIQAKFVVTTVGTGSVGFQLTNLPFTSSPTNAFAIAGKNLSSDADFGGFIESTGTTMRFVVLIVNTHTYVVNGTYTV